MKFPGRGRLWLGGGRSGLLSTALPVCVWRGWALSRLAGGSMSLTVYRDSCVLSVIQFFFLYQLHLFKVLKRFMLKETSD